MVKSFHTIWKYGKQEGTSDKSPSSSCFPAFQIPIDSGLSGLGDETVAWGIGCLSEALGKAGYEIAPENGTIIEVAVTPSGDNLGKAEGYHIIAGNNRVDRHGA